MSAGRKIEGVVRGYGFWPATILVLGGVLVLWGDLRHRLPAAVSGEQKDIYITLLGACATLLGFTLAALTFIAAIPADSPILERLHGEGAFRNVLLKFWRATARLGVLLAVSLVGLILDRQPAAALDSKHLGDGAYWAWPTALAVLACAVGLTRALGVLLPALRSIAKARETDALVTKRNAK